MINHEEYCDKREMFVKLAKSAENRGVQTDLDYYTGVIRGLDLAFQDGSAKLPTFGKVASN